MVNEILLANQLEANRVDLVHESFDPPQLDLLGHPERDPARAGRSDSGWPSMRTL